MHTPAHAYLRKCSPIITTFDISKHHRKDMTKLTTYNIVIGIVVAIGTFGYGFGFGVFITSIGQPGFYIDMDLDRE